MNNGAQLPIACPFCGKADQIGRCEKCGTQLPREDPRKAGESFVYDRLMRLMEEKELKIELEEEAEN